jgi:hypothetical protein
VRRFIKVVVLTQTTKLAIWLLFDFLLAVPHNATV